MRKFNKKKLPSRHTSLGPDRAPHRSFYYAMGETEKDVSKPFVGVVSTWNEAAPCNIALMRQAQSVKKGVRASGGTPREFCTITVTDGIAMGHEGMKSSLISREVIADSAELTVRGHCYDALVGIAGCDKSLMSKNEVVLKKLGRINNFYEKDQQKPSATLVISGDIFKIYFDENVDLNLIKENLLKRQNKYQEEMDKISQRLSNKGFTDRAPKNIVEQEKTNYSNLKDDIKKISLTIESL